MRSRGEITLKNAKIPAVVEKIHQKSVWCTEILNGIGKQKIELLALEDLEFFSENSVIPVVCSTKHFLEKTVSLCKKYKLRPVVVGTEFAEFDSRISSIKANRKDAVSGLVRYCKSLGRDRIAMLGINNFSNIDTEKRNAFVETLRTVDGIDASKDVYCSDDGGEKCIDYLLDNISGYNAVMCANDYFATGFVVKACERGIRVPEDVIVIGYGNSVIGERISPSITTVAPKYYEMGRQVRKIYSYLTDNPEVTSLELLVGYDVIVRESTGCKEFKPEDYTHTVNFEPCINSIFNDEMLRGIVGIDTVLSCDDDTMKMILKGISEDMSYSALAEKLYLSDSAFRYKLNKIFNLSNIQSKSKLKQVLNTLNLKDDE